jgi:hypothetical protein
VLTGTSAVTWPSPSPGHLCSGHLVYLYVERSPVKSTGGACRRGGGHGRGGFPSLWLRRGWDHGLDTLVGKRIGVLREMVSYRGRVEIVLEGSDQIVAAPGSR